MTDLIPASKNQPTMSSREIAELTGKQHKHVIRDIRAMLDALGDGPDLGHHYEEQDERGYTACIHLDRELTETLVTGYSIPLRHKVIKRLHELESGQAQQLPQTLPEALRLAADMAEQNAQLTVANQQQADEIKALQNLFTDGMTPTEFAKRLNGVNCQKICAELANRGWLFRDFAGGWRVAAYARDKYLTERQSNIPRSSGQVMLRCTPVLLRDGAVRLHKLYLAGELPMKASWNGVFTHDKTIDEKVA